MGGDNLCYVRDFSEHEPVDLTFAESLFKRAGRTRRFRIGAEHELLRLGDEAFHFPKVTDLIGRDPEQTVGRKCTMYRGEKLFGYHPTAPMPPFGPGIRKHQMKQGDGIRRQHLPNCIGRFYPQDARIGELASRDLPPRSSNSLEETFNSKKIPIRIGRGHLHEKRSISAPKINLDRSASTIDGL